VKETRRVLLIRIGNSRAAEKPPRFIRPPHYLGTLGLLAGLGSAGLSVRRMAPAAEVCRQFFWNFKGSRLGMKRARPGFVLSNSLRR